MFTKTYTVDCVKDGETIGSVIVGIAFWKSPHIAYTECKKFSEQVGGYPYNFRRVK